MNLENPFTGVDGRPCTNCGTIVDGDRGTAVHGRSELGDRMGLDDDRVGALCRECVEEIDPDPMIV